MGISGRQLLTALRHRHGQHWTQATLLQHAPPAKQDFVSSPVHHDIKQTNSKMIRFKAIRYRLKTDGTSAFCVTPISPNTPSSVLALILRTLVGLL